MLELRASLYCILQTLAGLFQAQSRCGPNGRKMLEMMESFSSVQFSHSCLTFCDPMNCSTPGLPVHDQLPEFTQTHIH